MDAVLARVFELVGWVAIGAALVLMVGIQVLAVTIVGLLAILGML